MPKKPLTFVSVDSTNLETSGVQAFVEHVKKLGALQIVDTITLKASEKKIQSNINNQHGRRFICVDRPESDTPYIVGYNVFCKALLQVGGVSKLGVVPDKKEKLEAVMRSQAFQDALNRQKSFLVDSE